MLKSPSGAHFRVTSSKYIDVFLILGGGELRHGFILCVTVLYARVPKTILDSV